MPKTDNTVYESDFIPILYEGATKGISRGQASHLIPKTSWWNSLNFRFVRGKIQQIPSLKPCVQLPGGDVSDVQALAVVNVNSVNATLAVLSQTGLYNVGLTSFTATQIGSSYTAADTWSRWAWMSDLTTLYFTKVGQQIQKYIPGTGVSNLITSGLAYGATYMENYYNHLVIANTTDPSNNARPNRIAWSDVTNFTNFLPSPTNEADFFELESVSGNSANGAMITGMGKIGGSLYIYTSTSIWQMQYVGLPNVMITQVKFRNIGNYFPYTLAQVLDTHYFIGAGGFYMFDGTSIITIGEDIWEYFRDDFTRISDLQNKTHCIVDSVRQEIVWYYCSRSSDGTVDKALIYNIVEKTWAPIEGRKIMSMQGTTLRNYVSMDNLTGQTFDSLTGTMDNLVGATPFGYVLYGTSGGFIRREVNPDEFDLNGILPESKPFLETGDIHYGSLGVVKELSGIRLDATWSRGNSVSIGLFSRFYISQIPLVRPQWYPDQEYAIGAEVVHDDRVWRKVKSVPAPVGFAWIDPQYNPLWTSDADSNDGSRTPYIYFPPADVMPSLWANAVPPLTDPAFFGARIHWHWPDYRIDPLGNPDLNTPHRIKGSVGGTDYYAYWWDATRPSLEGGPGPAVPGNANEGTVIGDPTEWEYFLYNTPPTAVWHRTYPALGLSDDITINSTLLHWVPGTEIRGYGHEWILLGYVGDPDGYDETHVRFADFGDWIPKNTKITAGWLQTPKRTQQLQLNRVHRWRFTFNGPTNADALQPQNANFFAFEENVYNSKSEL